MKKRLTYVNPWQVGKVLAALYAVLSVFMVPFFFLMGFIASHAPRPPGVNAGPDPVFAMIFGGIGLIILPIFYIIFGYIFGVIAAAIYNLVAKWTGGIEFVVTEVAL